MVHTQTSTGDARQHSGMHTNIYAINEGMADRVLLNADAEMMIVPEFGEIVLFTEMGRMPVPPGHIAVVPRGMMVKVQLSSEAARGYLCENYGAKFTLPDRGQLGPIASPIPVISKRLLPPLRIWKRRMSW